MKPLILPEGCNVSVSEDGSRYFIHGRCFYTTETKDYLIFSPDPPVFRINTIADYFWGIVTGVGLAIAVIVIFDFY